MAGVIQLMELTEKEKKALRNFDSKKIKLAYRLTILMPIMCLILAILYFYLVHLLASIEGMSFIDILSHWVHGIECSKDNTIPCLYLVCLEKLYVGLMLLSYAIIFGLSVYATGLQRKSLRKIIEILKRHNEL